MKLSKEQITHYCAAFNYLSSEEETTPLALSMMQLAIKNAPDCADFRLHLARFFMDKGESEKALPHFKRFVEIEPNDLYARTWLVHALLDTEQYRQSIEHLAHLALYETGREAHWHNQMGLVYYKMGDLDSAFCAFRTALDVEPDNPVFRGNLGHVLCDEERFDEAIPHLEVAIEHYPEDFGLRHDLGYSLNELGRFAEAIPHLECAAKLDPENIAVRNNLAYALNNEKKFAEAISHLEHAVKLDPTNPYTRLDLGVAYNGLGKHAKALPHLKIAIQLDRTLPHPHLHLAESFRSLGRPMLAATQLRKVFALASAYSDKAKRKELRDMAKAELAKATPNRYPHKTRGGLVVKREFAKRYFCA